MKHIICSSFGKDSNATALLALQHGEPLDEIIYTEVMFSKEISGELPEHARFIYETAIPYFESAVSPQGFCTLKRHIWIAFTMW